jgi:tetratricopeptide (TPR) repeat protein
MIVLTERFDELATEAYRAALEPLRPLNDDEAVTTEVEDLVALAEQRQQVSALLIAAESLGEPFVDELLFTFERLPPQRAWWLLRQGLLALPEGHSRLSRSAWWARLSKAQKFMGVVPSDVEFDLCAAGALANEGQLVKAVDLARARAEQAPNDFGFESEEMALCALHVAVLLDRAGKAAEAIGWLQDAESAARALPEATGWELLSEFARTCLHVGRIEQGLALFEPLMLSAQAAAPVRRARPDLPVRTRDLSAVERCVTDLFDSFNFTTPSYLGWMNLSRLGAALQPEEAELVTRVTRRLIELDVERRGPDAWAQVDEAIDALQRHGLADAGRGLTALRASARL